MQIHNLNPEILTVGWVVGQLADTVQPFIPGLTGSFFVKATYRLQPDDVPLPWPDKPLPVAGDKPVDGDIMNGLEYASDFVPYKPRADFAVVGTAHPPPGRHTGVFTASATVGPLRKEVAVFGSRSWVPQMFSKRALPGPAGPATAVPLRYTQAWGSPNSQLNPIGLGPHAAEVPRLEPAPPDPDRNYRHDPEPVAFGPIPAAWPFRQARVGTYSKQWSATRWPWLPLDFDWSHYNATAPDQWFDGYLRGDEPLVLRHMHVTQPLYESRLPSVKARLFVEQLTDLRGEADELREVPLDLDTLWIDMDKEQMALVWRGRAAVLSTKLKDVKHLMLLVEPLDEQPRSLSDYAAILAVQKKPKQASPPSVGPAQAVEQEFNQTVVAITAMAEKLNRIAGQLKDVRSQVEAKVAEVTQLAGQKVEAAVATAKAYGVELVEPVRELDPKAGIAMAVDKLQKTADRLRSIPGSPPDKIAAIEAVIAEMKSLKIPEKPAMPQAPVPPAALPPEPFDIERARRGEYVNANLQDRDLSGLDLSGLDFSRATFARSKFIGTILRGTILHGCDLTHTTCTQADFTSAVLNGADCAAATFTGARFRGASIAAAKLAGLDLGGADFAAAVGSLPDFTGANLAAASFAEANLPRAIFTKSKLGGADFSRSTLPSAAFESVQAAGANFTDANLTNFRGGGKADFSGATFDRAAAAGSIWKQGRFDGASFVRASLMRAIFEDSSLREATFDRSDLMKATFEDADLHAALLTNANLLRVNFAGATLTDARLDGSNLYEATFRDTVLIGATWRNANVKKSRLALR